MDFAGWTLIYQSETDIYAKDDYHVQIRTEDDKTISYYWRGNEVVFIVVSPDGKISYIGFNPLDNSLRYEPQLDLVNETILDPPFYEHLDYFMSIYRSCQDISLNVAIDGSVSLDGLRNYLPICFNFTKMRFCYSGKDFISFEKDLVIFIKSDEHYMQKISFGSFSDDFLRILVPEMDDFFKVVEGLLPQPIAEEIIPHLLHPPTKDNNYIEKLCDFLNIKS